MLRNLSRSGRVKGAPPTFNILKICIISQYFNHGIEDCTRCQYFNHGIEDCTRWARRCADNNITRRQQCHIHCAKHTGAAASDTITLERTVNNTQQHATTRNNPRNLESETQRAVASRNKFYKEEYFKISFFLKLLRDATARCVSLSNCGDCCVLLRVVACC
jgi:hypothetical protein